MATILTSPLSMADIHPTAVVDPKAELGARVKIGSKVGAGGWLRFSRQVAQGHAARSSPAA